MAFHHHQRVIKPELNFQLLGDFQFRLNGPIPPHILDNLCGSREFTKLPKFISKSQDKNGTELKADLKDFIAKTKHTTHFNHMNTCMAHANVICGRLGSITYKDPCTNVIIWDTGA